LCRVVQCSPTYHFGQPGALAPPIEREQRLRQFPAESSDAMVDCREQLAGQRAARSRATTMPCRMLCDVRR
jgi:hypothetical protein